jgi:transposase
MNVKIERPISPIELRDLYRREQDTKTKVRLLAIKLAYEGKPIAEIAQALSMSQKTVYSWIHRWNEGGYQGLQVDKKSTGRRGYLSREEWAAILPYVTQEGYSIQTIIDYVACNYGVSYSYQGVWKILRRFQSSPNS